MANLRIKSLKFTYNNGTAVFNNLDFNLNRNRTLSIIGTSASGKSTLVRLLNGELSYKGEIFIDDILVCEKNKKELSDIISAVYRGFDFKCETVYEELVHNMVERNYSDDYIDNQIDILLSYFNIEKLFDKQVSNLKKGDKYLVKILSYAIMDIHYLILDGILMYLDLKNKLLLLNYLNSKEIILFNVTSDLEDVIYTDYCLCLYKGKNAIDGKTFDVLKEEKLLKRLGFSLPFMYDLSIQLKLYGLINKYYLNKEEMVKYLWK